MTSKSCAALSFCLFMLHLFYKKFVWLAYSANCLRTSSCRRSNCLRLSHTSVEPRNTWYWPPSRIIRTSFLSLIFICVICYYDYRPRPLEEGEEQDEPWLLPRVVAVHDQGREEVVRPIPRGALIDGRSTEPDAKLAHTSVDDGLRLSPPPSVR